MPQTSPRAPYYIYEYRDRRECSLRRDSLPHRYLAGTKRTKTTKSRSIVGPNYSG